ncbi:hypothetical protein GGS24DRAFT_440673 [Hypoxylon argillaceum]|nr:hypothetical protein GGS24DRAFT_440673 [Hypoxylon argillaceum]
MCGRYALALRPSQIRRMLRDDNMPVYETPDDPNDSNDENDENEEDEEVGSDGPRQSYNFAPGYRGVVYRADVPDWGAGPRSKRNGQTSTDTDYEPPTASDTNMDKRNRETDEEPASAESSDVRYRLQSMKWGLIPFWTKRNPGYGSVMKTINCRDDSLAQSGGMWGSMKARKRCIVVAQGFYEWLKKDGGREKLPHYVKRKDGKLMCLAGLWDMVQYENDEEKQYTYTIITTDSNKQLNFLHDRMPVILDNGSEKMRKWLDPKRYEWSKELQSLLVPYDGALEVYPVSKDVGKVGNNSPTFIIPIDSKQNKSNIANFFAKSPAKKVAKKEEMDTKDDIVKTEQPEIEVTEIDAAKGANEESESKVKLEEIGEDEEKKIVRTSIKREAEEDLTNQEPPRKLSSTMSNKGQDTKKTKELPLPKGNGKQKISATSNNSKSPAKTKPSKSAGTQKITKFFTNSS